MDESADQGALNEASLKSRHLVDFVHLQRRNCLTISS